MSYAYSKLVHDDYYTRKSTWSLIKDILPKDKVIWEACLLNSNEQSKTFLKELGFTVVGNNKVDILKEDLGDVIVTNIPFSTKTKIDVLTRIKELDKPFCLIMNSAHIHTKYFKNIFGNHKLNYIIPSKKIHYDKYIDGELQFTKNKTPWYTIFVTYKLIDDNIII